MFDITRDDTPEPASERIRVLFVGHAGSPTGFARVLHSLLRHLPARYALHHLGINLHAPAPACGWSVHANPRAGEVHAESTLPSLAAELRPRLVFVLDEPWAAARHRPWLESRSGDCRALVYAAVDAREAVRPEHVRALATLDGLVAFTRFGRDAVLAQVEAARALDPGLRFPEVGVVPHGIDTDTFHPLARGDGGPDFDAGRRQARRLLFPERRDLDDAFIVLNATRNQPAKRIDLTLEGFALFARDKPANVRLYLHMGTAPPAPGTLPLVDRLGLRERLLVTAIGPRHPDLPSARLNLVYNACDVGVNTSEGEGFGLVSCEHAATGAAQVVPDHSACAELWRGAALLLAPVGESRVEGYRRAGRTVTAEGLAAALEELYARRERRRELAQAAYRNALRPELQWRHVAREWDAHFRRLLGEA
jgi:glycosyltransferase involved in cell wall biosynthesis